MTDPLAMWWAVPIASVERAQNGGAGGKTFAAPDATLKGRVNANTRLVRDKSGNEVVSSTRISLPITTPKIPLDSLVRVHPGDTKRRVIGENRHESGTGLTPDYYSIDLD